MAPGLPLGQLSSADSYGTDHLPFGQGSLGPELNVQVRSALESADFNVSGQIVLVLGSGRPWLEVVLTKEGEEERAKFSLTRPLFHFQSLLLLAGARHVVTVDYVRIITDHPKVSLCACTYSFFLNKY